MKPNIKALTGENGRYLEEKFNENKRLFLIHNLGTTERDFLEHGIKELNSKEVENERMWNLSDDDFFQEFRKNESDKRRTTWGYDEEENKKLILRNYRKQYEPSEFETPLLTLYKQKLQSLPKVDNATKSITSNETTLKWEGTPLQLTELTKALCESKMIGIGLTQKDVFERMRLFFEVDEFNENDKLKDIRKRTLTETPLINTLETSLRNWIKKKD